MFSLLLISLATGAVAGFLAGLLGVGGGLVIVPALLWAYHSQGFAAQISPQLALGTSLASILFTSLSSVRSHHLLGNVRWPLVHSITPGILAGGLLGSLLAARLPGVWLQWFFVAFALAVSGQMASGFRPAPGRTLPNALGLAAAGGLIGAVSSWVGIGGGSLTVPFLAWRQVDARQAIGTSAAVGFPIAAAGAIGYLIGGWGLAGLPAGSAGFIHLPSLAGIVSSSVLLAPIGAHAASRLPVATLKRCFAGLLLVMAGKMLYSLLMH